MKAVLTAIALALSIPGPALAAERRVEGHVTHNGSRLELTDGYALRSDRGDTVTVYLYPVAVGERDIQAARAGQAWAVALRKPSPDPSRWDWCPTMEIDLQSVSGRLTGRGDLAFGNFMFTGLDRRNHTTNLTRSGDQARATVTGLTFEDAGGQSFVNIETRAGGLSYDGNSTFGWRVRARVPVFPEPAPEGPDDRQ
ncbi:hypothetical protein H0Z60_08220 [Ectothiorhodospiraceae bacterium WFHF3C12]|nr:hypothetical protein [Ectothiorhodospiraceae bacterium WFHF3C12]